jgi:hypothetical protein
MINNKDILNDTFIAYFDICELLNDIKKSYSNNQKEIFYQFDKDYYRQNIIFNSKSLDKQAFLQQLQKYSVYYNEYVNLTFDMIIVLLCCQSTYELPYKLLMNIYDIDSITTALTCDSKDIGSTKISINTTEDKIMIELSNKFLIKKIDENIILQKIFINLNLEMQIKNIDKNAPIMCVFTWKYESV